MLISGNMRELFFARNITRTTKVRVFEKRKRYIVRWTVYGIQKEEVFRNIDSAVSLFNSLVHKYNLIVTIL